MLSSYTLFEQSVKPRVVAAFVALTCVGMVWGVLPASAKTHEVEMTAMETEAVIEGDGATYKAWTFNGQFPGPVVRVTEGDTIKFTLHNPKTNTYPHAMDFHAAEIDFLKNYRAINPGETIS
ncbi:MAG: nitrite reductase, partial [Nitrospirae bacterium]